MKLRYSPTSPYVRKVVVSAIELGLSDQLDYVDTNPWDESSDIVDDNPLGRVPALTTSAGDCLYDSVVICEYLDSLSDAQNLFPAGEQRWQVLRQHAMMNGVLDAGINAIVERLRRPDNLKWDEWVEFQLGAVRRALAVMASEIDGFDGQPLNIAQITAGITLGYVDFRFADDVNWRADHPVLADWYESFSQRQSMQATIPKTP